MSGLIIQYKIIGFKNKMATAFSMEDIVDHGYDWKAAFD
jgi:hypothetical protein